jgi:hypothetical protein
MHREFRTAITTGYTREKFLAVQCDAHGTEPGEGFSKVVSPFGLASRPLDAQNDNGNYKGSIVASDTEGSSEQFSWCLYDVRLASKIPPLTKGSSALYNSAGAFVLLDVDNEVELHYVPQGANKAHAVTIGKTSSGASVICLQHADKAFLQLTADDAQLRGPGSAFVQVKGSDINLNGNGKVLGSLQVGGSAAQPVINATAFILWWQAVCAAVSAVPVYGAGIGAALQAAGAGLIATETQFLKGL